VAEVPTVCNTQGGVKMTPLTPLKTAALTPLKTGASVPLSVVRWIVEKRPLLILGLPGVLSLITGVVFGVWFLRVYALERQIATNVALAFMAFTLVGLFSLFAGIMLYAISDLVKRTNHRY
jgi:hypothetical protein